MAGPPFTIDTTTPAPTNIVSTYPANEVTNRTNIFNWLSWLSDPTTGLLKEQAFVPGQVFPTGGITFLVFYQQTAPTGWVASALTDRALRVVAGGTTGGSGSGTLNFSAVMTARTVSDVALTVNQLPVHSHTFSTTTGTESNTHTHNTTISGSTNPAGAHGHTLLMGTGSGIGNPAATSGTADTAFPTNTVADHTHSFSASGTSGTQSANHTHSVSGTTANAGTGATHNHTLDMTIKYSDVIVCSRT